MARRGWLLLLAAVLATAAAGPFGASPAGAAVPSVTTLAPTAGVPSGGTAVTIMGRGFTGATAVRFGSQDALRFRIDSDTADLDQITAFSPPWVAGTEKVVKVQVLIGSESSSEATIFSYVDGGFADTEPMTLSRRGHQAALLNDGTVLVDVVADRPVSGGARNSEIYDPGGPGHPAAWRVTGAPEALRLGQTLTAIPNGQVLEAGGLIDPGDPSAEIYNPGDMSTVGTTQVFGAWSPTAAMGTNRSRHGAVYLPGTGRVLVVGGATGPRSALTSAELFDPNMGTWSSTGGLRDSRVDHSTTLLSDGRVLVAGGRDGNGQPRATAEIYDPTSRKWTPTRGKLATARFGHRAATLNDGRVLVIGGGGADGKALGSAEVFDPATGLWSPAGSLKLARFGHTVTLLKDGRVLVAGGQASLNQSDPSTEVGVDSAEVYEPTSNTWSPTTSLAGARTDHTATLLDGPACHDASPPPTCGQVLVAGGAGTEVVGPTIKALTSAELFDISLKPKPEVSKLDPPVGAESGGTAVHILGSHLFGGHLLGDPADYFTVLFGAERASAVAVSDRELIAVSPPGQGPVDVTVTDDSGTSPTTGASQFAFGGGAWSPAAACPPQGPCEERADQTAIVLDPPLCHSTLPPPGYPCGKVLLSGKASRTFTDGIISGDVLTSQTAGFALSDEGQDIESDRAPYANTVRQVVDAKTIRLARASTGGPPVRFALTATRGQIYDPQADRWSSAAPMDHRHSDVAQRLTFTSTLLPDGTVLVTGGCCQPKAPQVGPETIASYIHTSLASATIYDPTSDRWSPVSSMTTGRVGHTATLLDGPACHEASPPPDCGKVLVVGGMDTTDYAGGRSASANVELFDPATRSWSVAAPLSQRRAGHTATLLPDGDVLVTGGAAEPEGPIQSVVPLVSAERFDLMTGTWTAGPDLKDGLVLHTATLLDPPSCAAGHPPAGYPCGSVMIAGGASNFDRIVFRANEGKQSVAFYDPADKGGGWTTVGGMHLGRSAHTATLLSDGSVLLVGGSPAGQTAEIYDPATRSSRLTVPLNAYRTEPTAALLDAQPCGRRCGQVLVVGGRPPGSGYGFFPVPLSTAELFTAAPNAQAISPSSGTSAGSASVVITGTGLADVTDVSFGGVPASFTVDSGSQITAVTPHHPAGTVDVALKSKVWPQGSGLAGRAPHFTFLRSRPAAPADLHATPVSTTAIQVAFTAVGSDADNPPPAARYQVRQSATAITNDAAFGAATDLCDPACVFSPPTIATPLILNISNLTPATTYHYAVKALDPTGVPGGLSNPASATTAALAPTPSPSTTAPPEPPATTGPTTTPAPTTTNPAPTTTNPPTKPARAPTPQVAPRTGTPAPATTPPAPKSPVNRPPVVVNTPALAPQASPADIPLAIGPKVLFTPAQQSDAAAPRASRRVIPPWLLFITVISVTINLGVFGAYLNRRRQSG